MLFKLITILEDNLNSIRLWLLMLFSINPWHTTTSILSVIFIVDIFYSIIIASRIIKLFTIFSFFVLLPKLLTSSFWHNAAEEPLLWLLSLVCLCNECSVFLLSTWCTLSDNFTASNLLPTWGSLFSLVYLCNECSTFFYCQLLLHRQIILQYQIFYLGLLLHDPIF